MLKTFGCALGWLLFVLPVVAQDGSVTWKNLQEPSFDSGKFTDVRGLVLTRDRICLTFGEGQMQFSQPLNGLVYGAAFRGNGRVRIQPPNDRETHQAWLHTGQEVVDLEFTEATLVFSDQTFEEVGKTAAWRTGPDSRLRELYLTRLQQQEEAGAEMLPRLFRSILSLDRPHSVLFAAELKTDKKGWIHVRYDGLDPEEIEVGQWTLWDGGVRRPDIWLHFPARDISVAEAFSDPLAKEDFLIRACSIDAEVTDGAELSAVATVQVDRIAPGLRVLLFYLDSNLRVESVAESGQKLEFFQPRDPKDRPQSYGDYVAVVLQSVSPESQKKTIEFRYRGKRVIRGVGQGQYFCQSYGWYPTISNSFATRSDFEMTFKVPKKFTLVATGAKVKESVEGNLSTSTWKSEVPLAVAGFAYGDFKVAENSAGAVTVDVYASKNPDDSMAILEKMSQSETLPGAGTQSTAALGTLSPSALAKVMAQEVANSINVFSHYFGPYPYKHLAVTNIPYSYGQGWPGLLYLSALSFLDATQRNALGIRDMTGITDFFRAHETSHQWWGHLVGWKSYHDQWLSEGLAQFSGNLYVQVRQNLKEYLNRLRRDKEALKDSDQRSRRYESLGPIWMGTRLASSHAPRGYNSVVYNKGGYVVHMLRMMLQNPRNPEGPDAPFGALMKDFCQTYGSRAASTEDFKAVVEKHMTPMMDLDKNGRMDWFFNQYVYGTGIPEYRLEYKIESAGEKRWRASGTLRQDKVPGNWKNILPVWMRTEDKHVRAVWIRATCPETPFGITSPFKPDSLSINDGEEILAEIK